MSAVGGAQGRSERGGVRAALLDAVRLRLAEAGAEPSTTRVAAALRAQGRPYGDAEVLDMVRQLRSEMVGAGPLDPLLADPCVTDVLVNGPAEVWVDRGTGLERVPDVRFPDRQAVRRLAQRLATAAGRRLDDARPWADARLPDGTRLHAVLPPVAVGCTHISLRVSRPRPFTLTELVGAGTLTEPGAVLLRAMVRARISYLVSGGTGSGKTTLLAALLGLVGPTERLVVVEDSTELRPDHPHLVRLEARPPNQEGAGNVDLRDLVRQALRMRPDRLVVGEVRGGEVLDLLAALNTGHEGGCGTVHANTAADVPARLEALASATGLGRDALHSQLGAALDAVVHMTRERDGRRRVAEIRMLRRGLDGLVAAEPAVLFTPEGRIRYGNGWEWLVRRCGVAATAVAGISQRRAAGTAASAAVEGVHGT
ncbi:TadA family conjugal transfer-associated ATPase [Streptacidiphilus sp. EB129]|uniref:TadA family conjugal transfer-associated ATPase n=1 Tax=Streptacidiphilus sp. EB129 TaxID=3156262 RepID=UPI003513446F